MLRYPVEDNFIEIQSKNTRDSWIIQKRNIALSEYPIVLYHKNPGQKYYHKHWQCYNVKQSISSIKSHDRYSLHTKGVFEVFITSYFSDSVIAASRSFDRLESCPL